MEDGDLKGSGPFVIEWLIDQTVEQLLDLNFDPEEQARLVGQIHGCLTVFEHTKLHDTEAWRLARKYFDLPNIIAVFDDDDSTATQAILLVNSWIHQDNGSECVLRLPHREAMLII